MRRPQQVLWPVLVVLLVAQLAVLAVRGDQPSATTNVTGAPASDAVVAAADEIAGVATARRDRPSTADSSDEDPGAEVSAAGASAVGSASADASEREDEGAAAATDDDARSSGSGARADAAPDADASTDPTAEVAEESAIVPQPPASATAAAAQTPGGGVPATPAGPRPGTGRSVAMAVTGPGAVVAGMCYSGQVETVRQVVPVPCASEHESEIFHVATLPAPATAPHPGRRALLTSVDAICSGEAFTAHVGRPLAESSLFVEPIVPTDESWQLGDRAIACTLYSLTGPRTGSAHGADL